MTFAMTLLQSRAEDPGGIAGTVAAGEVRKVSDCVEVLFPPM